ncbi:MAG: LytR family transcriptional regulator [Ruminiclostridium sp.]|nr:LytR family transcriptional regulator [Ruminiclostridium sp.]
MKFADRSIKWAVIVAIFSVVLVVTGYYAALIFEGKTDAGEVHAEDVSDNDENYIVDKDGTGTDNDPSPIFVDTADTKLTAGKVCSTRLVEEGSVNILIIGEDKASHLYDTIGIVSINKDKKTIKFIMIPRDTYIEYNKNILDALEKAGKLKEPGFLKINNTHHIGVLIKYEGKYKAQSISFLADVIKEKFGVEVNDYVKINTEGFTELVDQYGGVEINVPYDMNYEDPTQELSIHLQEGIQHLDGSQAEGFVRFRQGWKEDGTKLDVGDIERKKNQIDFLKAFIKQHGTIKNIGKIPETFRIMGRSIISSIGAGAVLTTYIGLAKDIIMDKYEVESVIPDGKQIWINGSAHIDIQ